MRTWQASLFGLALLAACGDDDMSYPAGAPPPGSTGGFMSEPGPANDGGGVADADFTDGGPSIEPDGGLGMTADGAPPENDAGGPGDAGGGGGDSGLELPLDAG